MNIRLEGEITINKVEWTPYNTTLSYTLAPRLNPSATQPLTLSGILPQHMQDRMRFIFEEWLQGQLIAEKMAS